MRSAVSESDKHIVQTDGCRLLTLALPPKGTSKKRNCRNRLLRHVCFTKIVIRFAVTAIIFSFDPAR